MNQSLRQKQTMTYNREAISYKRNPVVCILRVVLGVLLMVDDHVWVIHSFTTQQGVSMILQHQHRLRQNSMIVLYSEKIKQKRSTSVLDQDDEKPAGIVGAQFFGGNKEKEEFYDPQAEIDAGLELRTKLDTNMYHRFQDQAAFPDSIVASIAESYQNDINRVLFADENTSTSSMYVYSPKLQWETMFSKTKPSSTPLVEIENALSFYRRVNIAIVSGEMLPSVSTAATSSMVVKLRWEISVQWPIFWEPRILLTGSSTLTIDDRKNEILTQTDTIDADLVQSILHQIFPRFWDVYHIGMTPAAEVSPMIGTRKRNIVSTYRVVELPGRLVIQPSMLDTKREDSNAATVPNHAFSCMIKTMGPEKQLYTPVTGVQVRIVPTTDKQLRLVWNIPISTEYVSNPKLVLPGSDPEMISEQEPICQYTFLPRRLIATISFGGNPQDTEISNLRKKLYDQVSKDGYKPATDTSGRPIFFFIMNAIKVCYTDEGLGMAVYEWRPQFTKPNEIAMELEF